MISWVIGGDSGIGEATANELGTDPDREVIATSKKSCDVTNISHLENSWRLLDDDRHHEPIEIVYSAGVNYLDNIGETDVMELEEIFQVNVLGFINLLDVLRGYNARDVRLVAVSSDAAVRPMRTSIAYCASKAALNMAVRVAARELAVYGWRVNAVAPGMTEDTGMTAYIDARVPELRGWTREHAMKYELEQAVIKRRAQPQEIAEMIRMVLDAPDYLNGAIIPINGGR